MFDQLKPLMQNGERYIVVEGGRPEYVLLRFTDYAALAAGRRDNPGHHRAPGMRSDWERANAELGEVREPTVRTAEFSAEPIPQPADPTTIRLEDLPL
jgi:hypothetical protein